MTTRPWKLKLTAMSGEKVTLAGAGWSVMPEDASPEMVKAAKYALTHLSVWVDKAKAREEKAK